MSCAALARGAALVAALAIAFTAAAVAQPPPKPNLSGSWTLDREISTDPASVAFDRQGGRSRLPAPPRSPDEQTRLRELVDQIRKASASLVISHNDPSLAITDSQGHTQIFQTTGDTDQHQLASVVVESATHWDGARLVTAYTVSTGRRLVYTYTLLPATRQLVVRIRLDGDRARAPEVKFVYIQTPGRK
jgi:hypothetical protein